MSLVFHIIKSITYVEVKNPPSKSSLNTAGSALQGKRYHPPIFSDLKNPIPCAAMEVDYEAAQHERTS